MKTTTPEPAATYWSGKGTFAAEAAALNELIPDCGEVADTMNNLALERFRRASNCYYDLYNNGLCNRAAEFRKVFGFAGTRVAKSNFTDAATIAKIDAAMDEIIRAAAEEQGITAEKRAAGA
jgi:hypothetical protein